MEQIELLKNDVRKYRRKGIARETFLKEEIHKIMKNEVKSRNEGITRKRLNERNLERYKSMRNDIKKYGNKRIREKD